MRPSPSVAPEGDRSGVGLPPGRSVTFRVTLTWEVIDRLGCNHLSHHYPETPDPIEWFASALRCRACSITYESHECIERGDLLNHRVFQSAKVGRRLEGVAVTDRGRLLVSRILAAAQLHRDPVEIMLDHGRRDELEAMGALIPTWADAAVYLRKQLAAGAL